MTDPDFLDLDDVLLIHEEQLAKYGGAAGIRDVLHAMWTIHRRAAEIPVERPQLPV